MVASSSAKGQISFFDRLDHAVQRRKNLGHGHFGLSIHPICSRRLDDRSSKQVAQCLYSYHERRPLKHIHL